MPMESKGEETEQAQARTAYPPGKSKSRAQCSRTSGHRIGQLLLSRPRVCHEPASCASGKQQAARSSAVARERQPQSASPRAAPQPRQPTLSFDASPSSSCFSGFMISRLLTCVGVRAPRRKGVRVPDCIRSGREEITRPPRPCQTPAVYEPAPARNRRRAPRDTRARSTRPS